MTSFHSVVNTDSCPWAAALGWTDEHFGFVSNLIVLYILFLKANFTTMKIRPSELYSGGFSKSIGLELTTFPEQNYTMTHYITRQ